MNVLTQPPLTRSPLPTGWTCVSPEEGSIAPDDSSDSLALRHHLEQADISLIAVRHGQSETNALAKERGVPILCGQRDSPLTDLGRQQAARAAERLYESFGGDDWMLEALQTPELQPVLYTSPLSRAHDTALATANLLTHQAFQMVARGRATATQAKALAEAVEPKVDERIQEFGFGRYEMTPLPEVRREQPAFIHRWDGFQGLGIDSLHRFPGGESRADLMTRVSSFLSDVAISHPNQTVVMFAHLESIVATQTVLGDRHLEQGRLKIDATRVGNAEPIVLLPPR